MRPSVCEWARFASCAPAGTVCARASAGDWSGRGQNAAGWVHEQMAWRDIRDHGVCRGSGAAAKEFYDRAFGLPIYFEDPNSAVYNFGNTPIKLLEVAEVRASSHRRRLPHRMPARALSSR